MRSIVRTRLVTQAASFLAAALLLAAPAAAGPIFAGFPPPGGTSFSGSGSLVQAPGSTRSYSAFDLTGASWSQLYFNITGGTITVPGDSVTFNTEYPGDGGFGTAAPVVSGNTVRWDLTDTLTAAIGGGGSVTTGVRLQTTFFQNDGVTAISGANLVTTALGDNMPQVVLTFSTADLASWGGGFRVVQQYTNSAGTPLGTFLNSLNAGNGLSSNTSAAFWYDAPAAVPEPASLVLFGSGAAMLAARLRRRRSNR